MKHIELAKKLKELAEKGIGGEKKNAQILLSNLLRKHNLTIEDIEGEMQNQFYFKIAKNNELLFLQVVKNTNPDIKIYGSFPQKMIKEYHLSGNYQIECTDSEYIEIEAKFYVYSRLYKQELDVFFTAFCKANNLLVKTKESKYFQDLSEKEKDRYKRADLMSLGIKSETYRKQIEN